MDRTFISPNRLHIDLASRVFIQGRRVRDQDFYKKMVDIDFTFNGSNYNFKTKPMNDFREEQATRNVIIGVCIAAVIILTFLTYNYFYGEIN